MEKTGCTVVRQLPLFGQSAGQLGRGFHGGLFLRCRACSSSSSQLSEVSVACCPFRCTRMADRVWSRRSRSSLFGVTNKGCSPNSARALMIRLATACELLEKASSRTTVPKSGRVALFVCVLFFVVVCSLLVLFFFLLLLFL